MSFELKDLVKAKFWYKDYVQLLSEFDLTTAHHALIHHKRNRLITLAKYKKTIKLLSNTYDLQPYYNLHNDVISSVLSSNTYLTYDVVLESKGNQQIRNAQEKNIEYISAVRTSMKETWQQENSLSSEIVSSLRLKAAALDKIYEIINWARSSMVSDIILDEYIYTQRYQQALEYLNNNSDNIPLLKIYAKQIDTDILNAAKHCIFCYDEDHKIIAQSEESLITFEKNILDSTNVENLQEIVYQWKKLYQYYL